MAPQGLSSEIQKLAAFCLRAGCDQSDRATFTDVERHFERNLAEKTIAVDR
jgi:hypothetical protein